MCGQIKTLNDNQKLGGFSKGANTMMMVTIAAVSYSEIGTESRAGGKEGIYDAGYRTQDAGCGHRVILMRSERYARHPELDLMFLPR